MPHRTMTADRTAHITAATTGKIDVPLKPFSHRGKETQRIDLFWKKLCVSVTLCATTDSRNKE
jgi:hypothetical protein